jgi:hypothetical protein
MPDKVAWLTAEEKRYLMLRHKFSAGGETGVAEKEEFSWKAVGKVFKVRCASRACSALSTLTLY